MRDINNKARFYQASTSELYGGVTQGLLNETTPFHPRSPYACAKAYGFYITQNYREAYGMFACNGILFNHESPRRGENFVTRKITLSMTRIKKGLQDKLTLGNLDAKRDWGYAGDYVKAMWLMLQAPQADDYVIATGENHSVREFVEKTAAILDIPLRWSGTGVNEKGIDRKTGKTIVDINPVYYRPSEVDHLLGDSSKAKKALGWQPEMSFDALVRTMVESDMALTNH